MLAFFLLPAALAVRDPPDYRERLFRDAAERVSAMTKEGRAEEAIDWGLTFQRRVAPAAPVAYEVGLAYRLLRKDQDALANYDRALGLDPALVAALYDRGEVLLLMGRKEEARRDFARCVSLKGDHWAGHFRLAEFAARDRDVAAFESELTEALRYGFNFRFIVEDPAWRAWARDPDLGAVLAKLIVVYSDEEILDALRQPM